MSSFSAAAFLLIGLVRLCSSFQHNVNVRHKVSATGSFLHDDVGDISLIAGHSEAVANASSDVLFLVRSYHGNYDTKVKAVLDTWASTLKSHSESLLIVGDEDSAELGIVGVPSCGNDHSVGLACRDGAALEFAIDKLRKFPSLGWVFVADDDLYVRTDSVIEVLSQAHPESPVAYGIRGCGPEFCDGDGGFCGGGGFVISRAALSRMAPAIQGRSKGALSEEIKDAARNDTLTGGWDDIATSCTMKRYGIEQLQMTDLHGGLHGWKMNERELKAQIHNEALMPLSFHYQQPEDMVKLHDVFTSLDRDRDRTRSIRHFWNASSKYEFDLQDYMARLAAYVNQTNRDRNIVNYRYQSPDTTL